MSTPTDPREEKQMRPCEHRSDGLCGECLTALNKYMLEDEALTDRQITALESTNSKLAAEIAELKAQKRPFSDKLADEVIKGQLKRITELETSLATLRAELEAARKERDEAKEEFRKAAEWNRLTELELTNLRRLNADLDEDLAALRAEVEAFTKHVGGPTFKDSVDVLLRTKSQDEDKIAEMFGIIKRTGAERDTALAAKDTAERERDRMRDVKWEGILAIEQQRDAAEKIVTEAQSFLTAALTEQITHAEHWVNHYSADPLGKSDRAHWDGKARAFTACLDLITSALTPAPTQEPPAGGVTISTEKKPIVVCLCGSSKYPEDHMRVMMSETLAGRIVIPMGLYGHADVPPGAKAATNDGDEATEVKQMLDKLHHRKIDLADEILVVNVGGYIGSSTKREIAYAESKGKRVRYLQTESAVAPAGPADVPSEGRGEPDHEDGCDHEGFKGGCKRQGHAPETCPHKLLPFNLSDALSGKPVITRDGSWTGFIEPDPEPTEEYKAIARINGGFYYIRYNGWLTIGRESPLDLFMLPTEGSGA